MWCEGVRMSEIWWWWGKDWSDVSSDLVQSESIKEEDHVQLKQTSSWQIYSSLSLLHDLRLMHLLRVGAIGGVEHRLQWVFLLSRRGGRPSGEVEPCVEPQCGNTAVEGWIWGEGVFEDLFDQMKNLMIFSDELYERIQSKVEKWDMNKHMRNM